LGVYADAIATVTSRGKLKLRRFRANARWLAHQQSPVPACYWIFLPITAPKTHVDLTLRVAMAKRMISGVKLHTETLILALMKRSISKAATSSSRRSP